MGLGQPEDLLDAVERGVDLFDCVVPTRNGRHGMVFTREGRLNLRNGGFRDDASPLDAGCACPACRRYSRAYLRHLLTSGEALGPRMLSLHNLAFYMDLLADVRAALTEGRLRAFVGSWRERYGRRPSSAGASSATDSAA
jgi:queuine tRNA-ribosyltransferase